MYCVEEKEEPYVGSVTLRGKDDKIRTFNASSYFMYQLFTKIKNGFSPVVVICGERRIGKSFLGLYLAIQYSKFMGDDFDFRRNTFYDSIKAMDNLKEMFKEPMIIDEASDILDPTEWATKTQRALRSVINVQAYKGLLYILLSPFVTDIAGHIRRHFDFCLYVTARGRFKAYRYVKKFNALEQKKTAFPYFLDDLGIKKSDIPKGLFEEYEKFSFEEKEKIRQKRQLSAEAEINPLIKNALRHERYKYG